MGLAWTYTARIGLPRSQLSAAAVSGVHPPGDFDSDAKSGCEEEPHRLAAAGPAQAGRAETLQTVTGCRRAVCQRRDQFRWRDQHDQRGRRDHDAGGPVEPVTERSGSHWYCGWPVRCRPGLGCFGVAGGSAAAAHGAPSPSPQAGPDARCRWCISWWASGREEGRRAPVRHGVRCFGPVGVEPGGR